MQVCVVLIADLCSMMSDLMNGADRRAPGCEKKTLELAQQSLSTLDFDKKLLAYQGILYTLISYHYFKSKPSAFVSCLHATLSNVMSSLSMLQKGLT
jgi:hypothetical protein